MRQVNYGYMQTAEPINTKTSDLWTVHYRHRSGDKTTKTTIRYFETFDKVCARAYKEALETRAELIQISDSTGLYVWARLCTQPLAKQYEELYRKQGMTIIG